MQTIRRRAIPLNALFKTSLFIVRALNQGKSQVIHLCGVVTVYTFLRFSFPVKSWKPLPKYVTIKCHCM